MTRRKLSPTCLLPTLLLLALCWASSARAHPMAPASLGLQEQPGGRLLASWRTSPRADAQLRLELPDHCRVVSMDAPRRDGTSVLRTGQVDCVGRGLEGARLGVAGLEETRLNAVLRIERLDGTVVRALLHPDRPSMLIPARRGSGEIFVDYLRLGVEHLWSGLDHVLFVLTLLMVVGGWRRVVLALSAFTVGHSVTLCLAALDVLRLDQGPVEVGIALSLVWVAAVAVLGRGEHRSNAAAAAGFGLLHGLGFASVLRATGLPPAEVPWSLFAFNVGIEVGQLALAGIAVVAAGLFVRWRSVQEARSLRPWIAYAIGGLAAAWVLERAAALI